MNFQNDDECLYRENEKCWLTKYIHSPALYTDRSLMMQVENVLVELEHITGEYLADSNISLVCKTIRHIVVQPERGRAKHTLNPEDRSPTRVNITQEGSVEL